MVTMRRRHPPIRAIAWVTMRLESHRVQPSTRVPAKSISLNLIAEGQEMLVQVAKSPIGTKGPPPPRITSHVLHLISHCPGGFWCLMPSSNHIGISRRIEDEAERVRLKEMVATLRKDDLGYIVRTAAEGAGESDKISQEMAFSEENLWSGIQRRYGKACQAQR